MRGGLPGDVPTGTLRVAWAWEAARSRTMSEEDFPTKPVLIRPAAGERGMSDLHFAAYLNDGEAVAALLGDGAEVDARDANGWTALHWSIDMAQAWGEPERVVSQLLGAGASARAVDNSGFSVLMMACGRNNPQILEMLLKAGADARARGVGTTPLHEAAGCNFDEGIRRLLEWGADPDAIDSKGRTPKQVAKERGFLRSFRALRTARRPM